MVVDFLDLMNELNNEIPVFFHNTKRSGIKPPYIVYLRKTPNNIKADNSFLIKKEKYAIEVYFTDLKKQLEIEEKIEKMLKDNFFRFSKIPDVEIDKNILLCIYEVERIIKNV